MGDDVTGKNESPTVVAATQEESPNQALLPVQPTPEKPNPLPRWNIHQWIGNIPQCISALCALVTAGAAICGVHAFVVSEQRERVKAAQDAVARIYPLDNELNRFLSDHTGIRECLRTDPDGKAWSKLQSKDREHFYCACSLNGNLFEYFLVIKSNIKDHPNGHDVLKAWDGYMKEICVKSYGFRSYIQATRTIWAPMFLNYFDENTKNLPFEKNVVLGSG